MAMEMGYQVCMENVRSPDNKLRRTHRACRDDLFQSQEGYWVVSKRPLKLPPPIEAPMSLQLVRED